MDYIQLIGSLYIVHSTYRFPVWFSSDFQAQEQDPTNLYLSNLPKHFDEKHLEEMLAPHGQVISTRILRDSNTQLSRGVGFAR